MLWKQAVTIAQVIKGHSLAFTPNRSIPPRKTYKKPTETARLRSLKTAVKNGAEREVRDLWLESRDEGTA